MRGIKAKKLRKKIYDESDFRDRKYEDVIKKTYMWLGQPIYMFTRISDNNRRWYQNSKKIYNLLNKQNKGVQNDESKDI